MEAASPDTERQWARTRPSRARPLPVPQREHITLVSPPHASTLARRGRSFPKLKLLQAQGTGGGAHFRLVLVLAGAEESWLPSPRCPVPGSPGLEHSHPHLGPDWSLWAPWLSRHSEHPQGGHD